MPDDSLLPTPGNPPEQHHAAPPVWWGALGRADLPDDLGRQNHWLELEPLPDPRLERRRRLRVWAGTFSLLLSLVVMVFTVVKMTPAQDVGLALLLFAIPTGLAIVAALVALHRGGS